MDFLLELRQVADAALGEGLDFLGGLGHVPFPRRGDADHIAGVRVRVEERVGHGGEVIAPVAAPVEQGLVQDPLLELRVLLGVDAGVQPVFLGLPALGADDVLCDFR